MAELQSVSYQYGEGSRAVTAVADCDFRVRPRSLTAVVGPSGCGKTTLGYLLAGYATPTSGTVTIDGERVRGPSDSSIMIFQETALFPWLSVFDNLLFGPVARGSNRKQARDRAEDLIARVGLSGFRDKYPSELSGGMQRRAELARALINDPALMIMDDPFRGLDAMTRQLIQEFYGNIFDDNRVTTVFITTDIDEAIFLADRIAILTARPASVCRWLEVDLPRPREREQVINESAAVNIKREALEILYGESVATVNKRLP